MRPGCRRIISPTRLRLLLVLARVTATLGGAACERRAASTSDAGSDLGAFDVLANPDSGPVPLALEFSATGCRAFDVKSPECDGPAPLSLKFTPIPTAGLTRFQWNFGDGSTLSSETSPAHTYPLPGSYTVTLSAGGSAGTVTQVHDHYVRVLEVSAGGACDIDPQCAMSAPCWCGAADRCDPIVSRGFCANLCDLEADSPCTPGTTCVDFARVGPVATPPGTHSPWGRMLCLQACADDTTCPAGSSCRSLLGPAPVDQTGTPTGPPPWTRACFSDYPFPIGARCNDPDGAPANADCATALCAALGRFGRCSFDCTDSGCPPGTACAQWQDGRHLCLAACTADLLCEDDPFLDCESPDPGADGFTLASAPASSTDTYCAPKPCMSALDCGASGTCPAGGGRCTSIAEVALPTAEAGAKNRQETPGTPWAPKRTRGIGLDSSIPGAGLRSLAGEVGRRALPAK